MIRPFAVLAAALVLVAPVTATAALPAPGGATVVDLGDARAYVEPDATVALTGLELFVRAGLDRQEDRQNGLAALVAQSVLRTPVDGVPLADAVEARGGSVTFAVAAQYARFYLEARPEQIGPLADLVARALHAPSFDPATLAAARRELGDRIADAQSDPRLVGLDMLRGSYYRDGAGAPALGTPQTLLALGTADAAAFYAHWYVRGDAFVTAVGRTGPADESGSRALVDALAPGNAPDGALAIRPLTAQPKRLVTHRDDVYSPYVVIGFEAPALGDRDFPAALVIRAILSDLFKQDQATVRPFVFRPIGSIYGYDADPAQLALWLNGSEVEPQVGLAALDALVKAAAEKPLEAAVLARYRQRARGEWALESLSLDERAWSIGNAVAHGLNADASAQVGAAIDEVTAADVERVAKKWFQRFDVALVLPRGDGG
ncbi:MAG TPA: insulinase family protein [Candidatus Sulfotelmatobacter sp.]|nr:insulinase family protein [Candidatus Sulfotelmatobacter sp.]